MKICHYTVPRGRSFYFIFCTFNELTYIHSASEFLVRTDACLSVVMKKIITAIFEKKKKKEEEEF